jgi:hypothetical protein
MPRPRRGLRRDLLVGNVVRRRRRLFFALEPLHDAVGEREVFSVSVGQARLDLVALEHDLEPLVLELR